MGLRIQNNVEAFNAHRQLSGTAAKAAKAMEKLSSGYRVNRAADDAAGLAISEKMRAQIGGLAQGQRNAQDAISLVQTGEGALNEVHSMLQRIRELKVQYDAGTLGDEDKAAISSEVNELITEIGDIKTNTTFNGVELLTGNGGSAGVISIGAGANTGESVDVTTSDVTNGAGMSAVVNATTSASFGSLDTSSIDAAIQEVSTLRSTFGSSQNRLEHRIASLANYQENLVAAESRIRDVDMAKEMVEFTKSQILQQAGTSMLAQANQAPQSVLSLLR
jgi:flagellin